MQSFLRTTEEGMPAEAQFGQHDLCWAWLFSLTWRTVGTRTGAAGTAQAGGAAQGDGTARAQEAGDAAPCGARVTGPAEGASLPWQHAAANRQ